MVAQVIIHHSYFRNQLIEEFKLHPFRNHQLLFRHAIYCFYFYAYQTLIVDATGREHGREWNRLSYIHMLIMSPRKSNDIFADVSNCLYYCSSSLHYDDVIMGIIASQITSLTIVNSTVYSGADQSKHQNSASLAFVWGIHRGPLNFPHKWPATRKMFPFDDVIMVWCLININPSSPWAHKQCPMTIKIFQWQFIHSNCRTRFKVKYVSSVTYLPHWRSAVR